MIIINKHYVSCINTKDQQSENKKKILKYFKMKSQLDDRIAKNIPYQNRNTHVSYNTARDQIVKQNLCSLPAGIKILKLLRCFRNNFYLWLEQLHGLYIKKAKKDDLLFTKCSGNIAAQTCLNASD